MLPVYDPKSFASVDLRKYHIRTVKDAIKFLEFTMSRMEEALFVMKKFNTQYATYQNVASQLQQRIQKEAETYGAGMHQNMADIKDGEIQSVEDEVVKSDEAEHQALLDEVRQAMAEETLQPVADEELEERVQAEFEKYKAVKTKTGRVMYYRTREDGKTKMVSDKDVPNDIKELLLNKMTDEEE